MRRRSWTSPSPTWSWRPPDKARSIGRRYRDRMRTNAQQFGDAAEQLVADRLVAAGWSISLTDAAPTPIATARARIRGARRSRCPAERVFESRTPGIR